ncbi:MAG: hypothetical protein IJ594_08245 [Oscillospiraceae bacterium]|nr:hypothetical protein [Oscillospiraceae bacterium]
MKRILAFLLVLLSVLTLAACGRGAESAGQQTLTVPGVDPASGQWIGEGGCFRLEPCEGDGTQTTLVFDGREYRVYENWDGWRLFNGDETVNETMNNVCGVCAAESGIWICEELRDGNDWSARFVRIDGSGNVQSDVAAKLPSGRFPRGFSMDGDRLALNCTDRLRIYDEQGTILAEIPHAEWAGRLLIGGDGRLYYVDEDDQGGGSVSTIDVEGADFRELFHYERGQLCGGDDEAPFLLIRDTGIDRLRADGGASPLVVWEECGLSVSGLLDVKAQPDGSYLLTGFADPLRMVPAQPAELKPRTKLTLGVLPMNTEGRQIDFAMANANLVREAAAFNAWSTESYVQLLDLSEGGTLSAEQAKMQLNTKILAGECPDMLLFSNWSLSPFPFVRKGLLCDLEAEFIVSDPELAAEDIVIAPMVKNDLGGLYLLGSRFSVETRYGLQERFGKVWGWDYDTYRRVDREAPQGSMVMYNLTRDYFLRESASRFLRSAIDWQSGVCDFDNADFVKLLEACRDMRETPEDPNNMVFGLPAQLMEGGYMLTSMTMIISPESFAREQREMGKPLSYIGFPTPDGSCGTDLSFSDAIGVMRSSAHGQACWQFLKYSLTHCQYSLPVYRPLLEERVRQAQQAADDREDEAFGERLDPPMTDGEVQGFYELLGQIRHTTLCDQTALGIIQEEFAAVLSGDKSPQEAARLVQSRMSLYVSEQN